MHYDVVYVYMRHVWVHPVCSICVNASKYNHATYERGGMRVH